MQQIFLGKFLVVDGVPEGLVFPPGVLGYFHHLLEAQGIHVILLQSGNVFHLLHQRLPLGSSVGALDPAVSLGLKLVHLATVRPQMRLVLALSLRHVRQVV